MSMLPSNGTYTGGTLFNSSCPDGGSITKLSGTENGIVHQMCYTCSGGESKCFGSAVGNAWSVDGPFDKLSTRAGWLVDNVMGKGGPGGNPYTNQCPAGQKLSGIHGRTSGEGLGSLGGICSVASAVAPPGAPATPGGPPPVAPPAGDESFFKKNMMLILLIVGAVVVAMIAAAGYWKYGRKSVSSHVPGLGSDVPNPVLNPVLNPGSGKFVLLPGD